MKEERLKVLEILQAGKINAEDASRLLDTLNKLPAGEDDAVKVKVKVETLHDDEDLEARIEEEIEAEVGEIEARIEEEIEAEVGEIEARIEEEIEEEVDEGVKMKIKVKTHHNEDA